MTDFPSDPETETFKDGDPLVTALVWEVDRAVKQAMREGGKYDTTIRHILNEHLRGLAQRPAVLHRADLIKEVSEIIAAGVADDLASDEIADNVLLSIDLIQRGALSDTSTDRPSCSRCEGKGYITKPHTDGGWYTADCPACTDCSPDRGDK